MRFTDMPACDCDFPTDPEKVRSVEEAFGLKERQEGCLGTLSVLGLVFVSVSSGIGLWWWFLVV
jgi:hypothetical protein